MAEVTRCTPSIQDIVTQVVHNLSHLPAQSSSTTTNSTNNDSVSVELNRAFRIPREQRTSTSTTTVNAISPSTHKAITAVANNFSANSNYGRPTTARRVRSRSCNGRFQPYRPRGNHRSTRDAVEPSIYYKDVCLLGCPEWEKVPRGEVKADLIRKNLYIDAWAVVKDWDEPTLRQEIGNLFSSALKDSRGNNVGFQFVKSMGSSILPIKLQEGQELNAKALKHVTGTNPIYIRTLEEINAEEEFESNLEDATSNTPPTSATSNVSASNSSRVLPQFVRDQLATMFPETSPATIANAVSQTSDVAEAIDLLLSSGRGVRRNDSCDDLPLATFRMEPRQALARHIQRYTLSPSQNLFVDRQSNTIIRDLLKKFKRGEIDVRKTPDVTFIGEEGIDANGLTKELCHLVMNALKNGKGGYILFEGKQDHLVPIICEEYNQSGYFRYVGMLIAMSVLHGGCGFLGLSRALSSYMVSDDIITASADLTIDDVPDYSVQETLTQMSEANSEEELADIGSHCDVSLLLYHAGFGNEQLSLSNKSKAIQCIMQHQVFLSRRDAITELKSGLDSINLLDLLLAKSGCLPLVFPLSHEVQFDASDLMAAIDTESLILVSDKEKEVFQWFCQYLKVLEEHNEGPDQGAKQLCVQLPRLGDLVQFMCGSPYLPTDGLIKVKFTASTLPDPEACFSTIKLPLSNSDYRSFETSMNIAVNCQHTGYGRG